MRSVPQWLAAAGLLLLAIYCAFALLFTAGGRDAGGIGSALLFWVGTIGGAVAVWYLFQRKEAGRWTGMGVYLVGVITFLVGALVSVRPAADRIFLLGIATANALGFFALYRSSAKG
jgi:hypothetical protein